MPDPHVPDPLFALAVPPRLGEAWIPATDVSCFLEHLFRSGDASAFRLPGGDWAVTVKRSDVRAKVFWGTQELPAHALLDRVLNQREIKVTRRDESRRLVVDDVATEAALDRAEAIQAEWERWWRSDPERRERLLARYAEVFGSPPARDYASVSGDLGFPGLREGFSLAPHQRVAVARMLHDPELGLLHAVGAGKTAVMVCGAGRLRSEGRIRKPLLVVPNHMVEQATKEWVDLVPGARLLAASAAGVRTPQLRREFVARAAEGDWDGIVMSQDAFEAIPLTREAVAGYVARQLAGPIAEADRLRADDAPDRVIAEADRFLRRERQWLERLDVRPREEGVSFEQMGVDYLLVDELHHFLKQPVRSHLPGVARQGSTRAVDLMMKVDHLRAEAAGGPCFVGTTATPVIDNVADMHAVLRLCGPHVLERMGLSAFPAWTSVYARVETVMRRTLSGIEPRSVTRFAREDLLVRSVAECCDVKTATDLALPVPSLRVREDGRREPEVVVVPPSPEHQAYHALLRERIEAIRAGRVAPEVDNMLKVTADAQAAALDMRLVNGGAPVAGPTKIDIAADMLAETWRATRDVPFYDRDGRETVRGALQLAFCDLSVPRPGQWNVYEALREALYARGLPPGSVRFAHEATTTEAKAALFEACRTGPVAVLIGSTATCGAGTNIQPRLAGTVHLDPAPHLVDRIQRDGRAERRGNQNPEIYNRLIVTADSADTMRLEKLAEEAVLVGLLESRDPAQPFPWIDRCAEAVALATTSPDALARAADAHQAARDQHRHTARAQLSDAIQRLEPGQRDLVATRFAEPVTSPSPHPTPAPELGR